MNHAVSVYGKAQQTYVQPAYTYAQRKRVYSSRVKKGYYLRRTGKIITVKEHVIKRSSEATETRFTFYGSKKDIKECLKMVRQKGLVPFFNKSNKFQDRIPARDYVTIKGKLIKGFINHPELYSRIGEWVGDVKERESP